MIFELSGITTAKLVKKYGLIEASYRYAEGER
jgi:hypothetical protein